MRAILAPNDLPDGPGRVVVDGDARPVDLSSLAAGIHVVKWDGTAGVVEYRTRIEIDTGEVDEAGDPILRLVRQVVIDDFAPYQRFVDAWAVANDPPVPTTLAEAVRQKDASMFVYRKSRQAAGYLHIDGNTYDVDSGSAGVVARLLVNVVLGLGLPGRNGPDAIAFWDFGGVARVLDVASLKKLLEGLRQVAQLKFERFDEHKQAVRAIAADTSKTIPVRIAAIAAYDHETGYPVQTAAGVGVTP